MKISNSYKIQVLLEKATSSPSRQKQCRKLAIDYLLWGLFARCQPIVKEENKVSIVVLTEVAMDGKGDWIAAKSIAELMQKKFPASTIHLIVDSSKVHHNQLLAPKLKSVSITYDKDPINYLKIHTEIKTIKESSLILIGPLYPDRNLFDEIKDIITPKTFSFTEYDAPTNLYSYYKRPNPPRKAHIYLGLSRVGIGIFTKSPNKKYTWEDFEHSGLKKILFGKELPDEGTLAEYQATHALFLCYMSRQNAVAFIEDTLSFENNSTRQIDICFPTTESIGILEDDLRERNEIHQKIKSIKTITYDRRRTIKEKFRQLQESGVELRIIDPGLLSARDFKVLSQISEKLMGVSSDHSLGQALSYGKVPSFVVPEGHKLVLLSHLLKLIKKNFDKTSALFRYIHAVGKGEISKFYRQKKSLLVDPELTLQAERLGKVIQQDFSAKPYLYGMANEFFLKQFDPEYAERAAELRKNFIAGEISIEQVEEGILSELIKRSLTD